MDVTVQIVECFSVFSHFVCLFLFFFLCWGVGFTRERVIIVSLCNNIHFSVSVTFYFDSQSPSVVLFFVWFLSEHLFTVL